MSTVMLGPFQVHWELGAYGVAFELLPFHTLGPQQ